MCSCNKRPCVCDRISRLTAFNSLFSKGSGGANTPSGSNGASTPSGLSGDGGASRAVKIPITVVKKPNVNAYIMLIKSGKD